ncbi:MAG: DUF523 domain-containing protein [Parcubacteria group bacterium]
MISACLAGVPCRWNKKAATDKQALKILSDGRAFLICPKVMAGLSTPRPACEIAGGDGVAVLAGKAKVVDHKGNDYTEYFIKGARKCLLLAKKNKIKKALLKSGSPSCGAKFIYAGDFSGEKKRGKGVLAALLAKNKIKLIEK